MELKPGSKFDSYEAVSSIGVGDVWMQCAATLLLFPLFISTAMGQVQSPKAAPKSFYVVNDEVNDRWCAYTSESEWRSRVDSPETDARTLARLEYTKGRVSSIYVTNLDDPGAGDWTIFDLYSLDKSEKLRSINRTINVIPGSINELEIWAIQNGKPVKESTRDPVSLKPVKPTNEWVPNVPIFGSVSAFPFWPLIHDRWQEILSRGSACVIVKRPPPIPPAPPVPVKFWRTFVDRYGWTMDYPSTWEAESSCPAGCPGEGVVFSNPETGGHVIVNRLARETGGSNAEARLQGLKRTRNLNPQVSEIRLIIDNRPALTVRYRQRPGELEMEDTYVVTDSDAFMIAIDSFHWKIEQLTDYPAYRHMLSSFKFIK